MPREWYCCRVEAFVAEISQHVKEYVTENEKLGSEIDGTHDTLVGEGLQKREPFAALADELLVTREWGDHIWGHRRFCSGPLADPNVNRETYTPKPSWPQDQER